MPMSAESKNIIFGAPTPNDIAGGMSATGGGQPAGVMDRDMALFEIFKRSINDPGELPEGFDFFELQKLTENLTDGEIETLAAQASQPEISPRSEIDTRFLNGPQPENDTRFLGGLLGVGTNPAGDAGVTYQRGPVEVNAGVNVGGALLGVPPRGQLGVQFPFAGGQVQGGASMPLQGGAPRGGASWEIPLDVLNNRLGRYLR